MQDFERASYSGRWYKKKREQDKNDHIEEEIMEHTINTSTSEIKGNQETKISYIGNDLRIRSSP
ncbi:hypothetical protein ccbrp13_57010 [Ktedonobacteria bacterium brp13]|nr:hypothetical protein ccbrp13_57010 [Ktedonobacteria bacterium brp13]